MRILWNAKDLPGLSSGYGQIGKHLLPKLAEHYGKDNIVIYAPVFQRESVVYWEGMKVLPGLTFDYGENMILSHCVNEDITFVLQVGDVFMLRELPQLAAQDKLLWVEWTCYDYLQVPEEIIAASVRSAWKIVSWTEYSKRRFLEHKLTNVGPAIPLGIDPKIWYPVDRSTLQDRMGALGFREDTFNILLFGANQRRKYWEEQLAGIVMLRKNHPALDIRLFIYTHMTGEIDFHAVVAALGLADIARYPDQYIVALGGWTEESLAEMVNCADVVLNCNLEGFGLVQLQAQACGVPVVTLEEGPGREIVKYGFTVPTAAVDYAQIATKPIPSSGDIAEALAMLIPSKGLKDPEAVKNSHENYSWDRVARLWIDYIDNSLMPERAKYSMYVPSPSERLKKAASQIVKID